MSADKKRAEIRCLRLLARYVNDPWRTSIPIHCEGGFSLHHPDIQWLVKKGYVRISRSQGIPKWSREFRRNQGKHFHSTPMIRRTAAVPTIAGHAALKKHKLTKIIP